MNKPEGIRSRSTIRVIHDKGMGSLSFYGNTERWRITPSCRAALDDATQ